MCDENGSKSLEATTKLSFLISNSQYRKKNHTCWSFSSFHPLFNVFRYTFLPDNKFLLAERNEFFLIFFFLLSSSFVTYYLYTWIDENENGMDFSQLSLSNSSLESLFSLFFCFSQTKGSKTQQSYGIVVEQMRRTRKVEKTKDSFFHFRSFAIICFI